MPNMVSMGIIGIICIMVGVLLVWVSFWLVFDTDPTVRSRSGRGMVAVLTRESVDFVEEPLPDPPHAGREKGYGWVRN